VKLGDPSARRRPDTVVRKLKDMVSRPRSSAGDTISLLTEAAAPHLGANASRYQRQAADPKDVVARDCGDKNKTGIVVLL